MKVLFAGVLMLAGMVCRAREIVDMAGARMTVPDRIERIVSYDPKTTALLYAVAGDMLIARGAGGGSAMHGKMTTVKFIADDYLNIKEIDAANVEEVMRRRPDIVVFGVNLTDAPDLSRYRNYAERSGIALVIVDLELTKLDKSLLFLGELLDRSDKARRCADFITNIYAMAAECRSQTPKAGSAYLAARSTGLMSAPENTSHTQVFTLLNISIVVEGALNAHGFTQVSLEQVLAWNPSFIFCIGAESANPYRTILKSGAWRTVKAVRERQVYRVPSDPFPWIDMPPSVNRIAGVIWLANIFYGRSNEETKHDITQFYRLFYNYELTDKDYNSIFN
jgi:iron complex transport system substrate-binding protein